MPVVALFYIYPPRDSGAHLFEPSAITPAGALFRVSVPVPWVLQQDTEVPQEPTAPQPDAGSHGGELCHRIQLPACQTGLGASRNHQTGSCVTLGSHLPMRLFPNGNRPILCARIFVSTESLPAAVLSKQRSCASCMTAALTLWSPEEPPASPSPAPQLPGVSPSCQV